MEISLLIAMRRIGEKVAAKLRISVEPRVVEFTQRSDCKIDGTDLLCDMRASSSKVFLFAFLQEQTILKLFQNYSFNLSVSDENSNQTAAITVSAQVETDLGNFTSVSKSLTLISQTSAEIFE
jgi:hypothetical protein